MTLPNRHSVLQRLARARQPLAGLAILFCALFHVAAVQANCSVVSGNVERIPDANLTNGTNIITHTTTGLIWKECVEGLSGDNACTTGSATTYTWQDALKRAVTAGAGWRLPSRNELLSLVETGCSSNMINTTRFPNTPASANVWTSTPLGTGSPTAAWAVRFGDGTAQAMEKSTLNYVRLVSGPAPDTNSETYDRLTSPPTGGPTNTFPPFTAATNQAVNALVTSNTVTLTGVTTTIPISIVGGEYTGYKTVTFTNGTDLVNWTAHGLSVGAVLQFSNSGGALPTGISAATNYYVTDPDQNNPTMTANAFQISATAGGTAVNFTTDGTGTNSAMRWTSAAGTIGNQALTVRLVSSPNANTERIATVTLNGRATNFSVTTSATANEPDNFVLTPVSEVAINTVVTSSAVTVTGLTAARQVTISGVAGATFSVGGDAFSATARNISNNQTLQVRQTSSGSVSTMTTATVAINGKSFAFNVITAASGGLEPLDFSFTSQFGVARAATISSDTAVVTGLTIPRSVTVSGTANARYKVGVPVSFTNASDLVNWTAHRLTAGTVISFSNRGGDLPSGLSSGTNYYVISANLTANAFQVSTTAGGAALNFTTDGTGNNYAEPRGTTVTFTNATDLVNWTGHGLTAGTILTFNNLGGALPTGITAGTPYYVIAANLTANSFQVSTTSAGATINFTTDGSGTNYAWRKGFLVTVDNLTDILTRTAHGLVAGSILTFRNSGGGLPAGMTAGIPYYVIAANLTANTFQISTTAGGAAALFTSNGTGIQYAERPDLMNDWSLNVSDTSSSSSATESTVTATINSRSFPFTMTTRSEPDLVYFEDVYGALKNQATCTTNASCATGSTTLSGITSGTSNTITASFSTTGAVQINGGAWAAVPSTPFTSNGADVINVRVATPNCNFSPVTATLTINGTPSSFTAWTGGGLAGPTGFTDYAALTGQAKNTVIQSAAQQTVTGLGVTPTCIRIENGEYQIGAAAWTSSPGTVANAALVRVRQTSSLFGNTMTRTILYVNGALFNFDVTTGP